MDKKKLDDYYLFKFHFFTTKMFLLILTCLFFFLSIYIPYNQKIQNTKQMIAKMETASLSFVRVCEIRYQTLVSAITRLRNLNYVSEKKVWINDAQFLKDSFNEIEYLAWIDQEFLIREVVPCSGNEILLNTSANSIQSGKSIINQLFSVFDRNSFQGFVLCSINLIKLIEPFENTHLEGFMIQVQKNGEVIYNSNNWEESDKKISITKTLALQKNVDISFICTPTSASIQAIQTTFYTSIVLAFMLSLLASLTVFLAQKFYFFSKLHETRYYNLLDDANLFAITLNTEGEITYCNDFFLSSTGWDREEILGTHFIQRFSNPDSKKDNQFFLNSASNGKIPSHTEFSLITKSGERRTILFNTTLQKNVKGSIIGCSALGEDVTEQKKNEESLQKQYEFLKTLFSIDQAITFREKISDIFSFILDQMNLQLGANASSVLLFNKETQCLEYAEGVGFTSREIQQTSIPFGEGITGLVAIEHKARSTRNLQDATTGYTRKSMAETEGFHWYHVEPLLVKDHINGALEIFFKENIQPDEDWYSFAKAFAQQTAIAIDNATLLSDLEKSNKELLSSYESTIEGWSRALDMRDRETEHHSLRVTEMTLRLCKLCGMSEDELINVRRGALLHDIGKMGIPDSNSL